MEKHRRLYRSTGCMQRRSGEESVTLVLAVQCRTRQRKKYLGRTRLLGRARRGVKGLAGGAGGRKFCGAAGGPVQLALPIVVSPDTPFTLSQCIERDIRVPLWI